MAGYTVEHSLGRNMYGYYTFGLPSLAAAGVAYYSNYDGNSIVATVGVGIVPVLHTSLSYQVRLADRHFLKLGAGYTTTIVYNGFYPALSYEVRFK